MRVLLLEPDPTWLAERRRLGLDRHDEVWDGVLHVVPSPTTTHQRFERNLERVLAPIVESLGFEIFRELDVLAPQNGERDYRQPDISVVSPDDVIERGINGHAELVVEIRSPNDESDEKRAFYARCGIPEHWIVDPHTRAIDVLALRDGTYAPVKPNADGAIFAPRFALTLRIIDGPKLRIAWSDGSAEI